MTSSSKLNELVLCIYSHYNSYSHTTVNIPLFILQFFCEEFVNALVMQWLDPKPQGQRLADSRHSRWPCGLFSGEHGQRLPRRLLLRFLFVAPPARAQLAVLVVDPHLEPLVVGRPLFRQ